MKSETKVNKKNEKDSEVKTIRVAELFAGVGGFRLGLEGWNSRSASSGYKKKFESPYEVVWSNQWEPSTKTQHASLVYEKKWGKEGHSNSDIGSVNASDIPDHDLLVGGFPCQDYSVATTLKNSKGLIGKKGVLWWSIHKILTEKKDKKPSYLFLENVDRLLISPSKQRGRDFAIILKSLDSLGYAVEWRVVNAAEYGMPQRRRRIFILAYRKGTKIYNEIKKAEPNDWIHKNGVIASAFPVINEEEKTLFPNVMKLAGDIVKVSEDFNKDNNSRFFQNTGMMINGKVHTSKTIPEYNGKVKTLGEILIKDVVDDAFYIDEKDMDKWKYLKGPKKEMRKNSNGFEYNYSEGGMIFPDNLDKPSRTIITGEGGKSPSRFKHVVTTPKGLRRLTPLETERLNMFPDEHTKVEGMSNGKRVFFMGNALVVGVIEKIGISLKNFLIG